MIEMMRVMPESRSRIFGISWSKEVLSQAFAAALFALYSRRLSFGQINQKSEALR
jgi:hypothetical protein